MARPRTDDRGQIQRQTPDTNTSLARMLTEELAPQMRIALPKHLDGDRMARIALTALRTTPKLMECDRYSFAACIMSSAQLGLEVNTPLGHAYLIPRWRSKEQRTECTLQLGYQGMIELARRSGQVSAIYAFTVHTGDVFEYELGLDPKVRHVPNHDVERTEATMTFVYAVAALRGSEDRQFVVLSKRDVEKRKAIGAGGPAWREHYLAMAKKTAVRALFTWLPKSPEMARAAIVDDAETQASPARYAAAALEGDVVDAMESAGLLPPPDELGEESNETNGSQEG